MSIHTFDPNFDLDAFMSSVADVLHDERLYVLCRVARERMAAPQYAIAVQMFHESEDVVRNHQQAVLLVGYERWVKAFIKKHGEPALPHYEGKIQQAADALERAETYLDNIQAVLWGRVYELRTDVARAEWLQQNPEAAYREAVALAKAKAEREHYEKLTPEQRAELMISHLAATAAQREAALLDQAQEEPELEVISDPE